MVVANIEASFIFHRNGKEHSDDRWCGAKKSSPIKLSNFAKLRISIFPAVGSKKNNENIDVSRMIQK